MENIALVTIKFPQNQTTTPDNTSTEECPTASSATQQTTPARSRPSTAKTTASLTKPDSASVQPSIGIKFLSAGLAACYADLMTFPLDTAKVRLQIQGEGSAVLSATRTAAAAVAAASPKYRGMFGTLMTISREEGVRALYNGLVPGLQRQMAFASIRIGLYDSVKHFYLRLFKAEGTVGSNNIGLRILAGITTGGLAVSCAQPTDVVKVRMQAAGQGPKRYKGCLHAYRKIAVEEGIRGLWKGVLPNITRNAIVNAAELVSYDLIKESIIQRNLLSDNMPCHFVSAFGAGFFATVVASPVDVVKTRFMNSGAGTYNGAADCAVKMFKEGGFFAFYKGFMPSYMRLGSWNIIMFVTFEQLKRFFVGLQRSDTISTTTTLADVSLQQKKLM